ncbi:putative helicase mov-10-B.1 isoform X3 [Paramormyrops kingsleyae]|uniref:RNA helicase n=1 Tax=Paramormyrops kingsleyae TaxID=1676925 RepID=A0A3B3T8R3_9TELE|nr:putative helicase mov-10-B.1 isoform X1 [Paramormyrops kingsleyae]
MPNLKSCFDSGLKFIDFLGEGTSETDKDKLKEVYDKKFRYRNGIKEPSFSNVIFALTTFGRAYRKGKKIYLNTKVHICSGDQWSKPLQKNKSAAQPVPNGGSSDSFPGMASPASAVPSAGTTTSTSSASMSALEPSSKAVKKRVKAVIRGLRDNRKYFIANKEGIVITSDHEINNGKIKITTQSIQMTYVVKFFIQSNATDPVHFTLYTFLCRMCCFSLEDEKKVTPASPYLLNQGDRYEVEVHFRPPSFGSFPATLAFEFRQCPRANTKPIYVVRDIEAMVRSPLGQMLGPEAPYKPYQAPVPRAVHTIVEEGEPPESCAAQQMKVAVKLGPYKYPAYLKELATGRLDDTKILSPTAKQNLHLVKALLESPLTMENYTRHFQLLLHLEELQMEVNIKKYNLQNQPMTQDRTNKRLLVLQVKGVAENRPSVLRGDHLLVSKAGDKSEPITLYKGYVHKVEMEQVKLGFSKKLWQGFKGNIKFDVEFTLNRFPLRQQHRAVNLAGQHKLGLVLFPSGLGNMENQEEANLPKLSLYDKDLAKNREQYAAVQCIVSGASRPAPYVVFGPPGTGKTVTIVEAIKQVWKLNPQACVLACAPSNSASDHLCECVQKHIDSKSMFRLYAPSRDPQSVQTALLDCSNYDAGLDCFVLPSTETLMEYKVIVSTVVTAGRLVSGGIPTGHFTHIFVDEAGHAMEPECLIAIAGLLQPGTGQLVLAGDPKQLGPVLQSPLAMQHGLGLSLLERLMQYNPLYQKAEQSGKFDSRFVTKLLQNYRSHPDILHIPNELFYDSELQVFADRKLRESCCQWEHLPQQGFPVIFHGVMGKDEREANSPSFFNTAEVHELIEYLKKLLPPAGERGSGILSPSEIGIISPYRKQVEKIRKAIKFVKELNQLKNIQHLTVGSVEEFQGQERKVIMVSTVRSSATYVKMDQDFNLGFLTNKKRFNVAMTRAKALLIVVGNPVILCKDPTWKRFIHYCKERRGCTGFDLAEVEEEDDVLMRLATLSMQPEPEVAESRMEEPPSVP